MIEDFGFSQCVRQIRFIKETKTLFYLQPFIVLALSSRLVSHRIAPHCGDEEKKKPPNARRADESIAAASLICIFIIKR